MFLRELRNSVTSLPGIGPKIGALLQGIGIETLCDLLHHFPRGYEDRRNLVSLSDAVKGDPINTVITVKGHEYFGQGARRTLKIIVEDETAVASLLCFGRNFLARTVRTDSKFRLYGHFQRRFDELQSSDFDLEPYSKNSTRFGRILPIYGLTSGLKQSVLRRTISTALDRHGEEIENEIPASVLADRNLLSKSESLRSIHFPGEWKDVEVARKSLIYEELFYLQLVIRRSALKAKTDSRPVRKMETGFVDRLESRLPFVLTKDQVTVIQEIKNDLQSSHPMSRLLQGDVGSGKTLVAFTSALFSIGAGQQVAFMAPTELLARQHAETAAELLEPLGIRLGFLSGNLVDSGRIPLLDALKSGDIDLLIGTHAIFSERVKFNNLGLVIIDEQQRFGVLQRVALMEKGKIPDLLLMTATPIPRSMALTVFGDLDVSTIKTMPPGRRPVETHLAKIGNEEKVYRWVRREVEGGRQAYFVYPLIRPSDASEVKDAESMFEHLRSTVFGDRKIALIHSQIAEEKKRDTMKEFAAGDIDILVATSVVEVGVNVPNATCMVVEHSERFGLAALHQLRGRVGRASHQSYAFLVYDSEISDEAKQRLKIMKNNHDGFRIAEEDLSIRGPGDLTGIRQSGYFRLTIADIVRDITLLTEAREEVGGLLARDPGLLLPEDRILSEVLTRVPPFADLTIAG